MAELKLPVSEETVRGLEVGDFVELSGRMITGRDAAHTWLMQDFREDVFFHHRDWESEFNQVPQELMAVEFEIDDERHVVRAGDCLYFDSSVPHRIINSYSAIEWIAKTHHGLNTCWWRIVAVAPVTVITWLLFGLHCRFAHLIKFSRRTITVISVARFHQLINHFAVTIKTVGLENGAFVILQP